MSPRLAWVAVVITGLVATAFATGPAIAIPPPRESRAKPTGSPLPLPTGAIYPVGTPLLFVMDEAVNSRTAQEGQRLPMHLREPLAVNGVTVAPAGTTGTLTIVAVQRARAPDTTGSLQIRVEPLVLPDGKVLPLRAIHEYLTPEISAGYATTRGIMDSTEDIFIPYLAIYQAFRKGRNVVIPRDSLLRVQTAATIDATNRAAVAITTPAPMTLSGDVPHSDFTPIPLYTPFALHPNTRTTAVPRHTPQPLPSGAATPSPPPSEPSPAVSTSPSAAPSAAMPSATPRA